MLRNAAKNLLSNYLLTVMSMALGFVLVPFLIGKLGKEVYGIIVLAESTILIFEIMTMSIRIALSRHAAFSLSQNRLEEFVEYLGTGRMVTLVSAAAVLIFSITFSSLFTQIFRVPAGYESDSRILFLMVSLAFSVTILNSIYWSVLYAHNRFDLINVASSGGLIVRAASVLIFFSVLPARYVTLPVYGLIHLCMVIVDNCLVYGWHRKLMPGLKVSLSHFRKNKLREILSFSLYSSLGSINTVLSDSVANFIINRFWGPGANALFSVALKFPSVMKRLFVQTAWALTPTFTDLVARNDKERFTRLYAVYMKFITIATAPLSLILIFIAHPLIRLWVGPEFEASSEMMRVLMLPLFIMIPFSVSGCITNAYAKVKLPSQMGFVFSALGLALGIFFSQSLSMGIFGIALGTAASACMSSSFNAYYACRISGMPFLRVLQNGYLKPVSLSLAVLGAPFFAAHAYGWEPDFSLTSVSALAALAGLNYLSAYFFVLTRDERTQILETVRLLKTKIISVLWRSTENV